MNCGESHLRVQLAWNVQDGSLEVQLIGNVHDGGSWAFAEG